MTRLLAAFCIVAYLSHAVPVSAKRIQWASNPIDDQITTVSNPCDLSATFININATIARLGRVALDASETTLRIHHSSKSRPYKQVENDWEEVLSLADPALDKLSNLPIALDTSPDGPKKKAAIALTAAYQKAIQHIVDYGHYVVNYERGENMVSQNFSPGQYRPGVGVARTRTNNNNSIRRALDAYITEANDALLSIRLPEHRYGEICHIPPSPFSPPIEKITDSCKLKETFFRMHETVRQIGGEAIDAGDRALQLRATSRSRPYKKIEGEWSDVVTSAKSTTEALTDLMISLDTTADGPKKRAAQNLTTAYKEAVYHFVDYTHVAIGLERTQSSISMNGKNASVTFGVSRQAPKAAGVSISRQQFNLKFTEASDTFYTLKIPESHYAKACNTSFPS